MARISEQVIDLGGAGPAAKFEMRQGERILFPIRWSPGVRVDGAGRLQRSENPHDITNWVISANAIFVSADYNNINISDFKRLVTEKGVAVEDKPLKITTEPTLGIAYIEFPDDFYTPEIDFDISDDVPAAVVMVTFDMKDTFKSNKKLKQPIIVLFRTDGSTGASTPVDDGSGG